MPPAGKHIEADYVYAMDFEGDRTRHMSKIWYDSFNLKQLAWRSACVQRHRRSYGCRSAPSGSVRDARQAGTTVAIATTTRTIVRARANDIPSVAVTP
jgi:hypothetical protein